MFSKQSTNEMNFYLIFYRLFCFFPLRNDSFVDPTPASENELKTELDRVAKVCLIELYRIQILV